MSYFGNWLAKPETPITPCDRQWLGRGPVEDVTTHKHDYSWKCVDRAEIIKARDNLCCPCASLSGIPSPSLSLLPPSSILRVR